MKIRKAIIPAAGLGTRFLPATKAIPKEMLPILDKPALQYIVEEAVNSGITEILIINGRNKDSIENYFDLSYELEDILDKKGDYKTLEVLRKISNMCNIYFIRQNKPLGLGHAVNCGKDFIGNEPFAVLLGDDIFYSDHTPCLKQLIDEYDSSGTSTFALSKVADKDISKYGIISGKKLSDNLYKVTDMLEKPDIEDAPSNLAAMGRYVFSPEIFKYLNKIDKGKGGELQLTDAMKAMCLKEGLNGYIFNGERFDTGYLLGFINTVLELGLKRSDLADELMELIKSKVK